MNTVEIFIDVYIFQKFSPKKHKLSRFIRQVKQLQKSFLFISILRVIYSKVKGEKILKEKGISEMKRIFSMLKQLKTYQKPAQLIRNGHHSRDRQVLITQNNFIRGFKSHQQLLLGIIIQNNSLNRTKMNVFVDIQRNTGTLTLKKDTLDISQPNHQILRSNRKRKYFTTAQDANSEKSYHWTMVEQKKYIDFLIKKRQIFDMSLKDKKRLKMYVLMTNYILTKNPRQCRSHHQKMLINYSNVDGILQHFAHLATPCNSVKIKVDKSDASQEKEPQQINQDEVSQNNYQEIKEPQYSREFNLLSFFDFQGESYEPFQIFEE